MMGTAFCVLREGFWVVRQHNKGEKTNLLYNVLSFHNNSSKVGIIII